MEAKWLCEKCGKERIIHAKQFLNYCDDCEDSVLIPLPEKRDVQFTIREYGTRADGKAQFYAIAHNGRDIANLGSSGEYVNLFAASPKLLDSCRKLLEMVLRLEQYDNFGQIGKDKIDEARRRIAAAEGRP